jgi:membrane protease YdiL (CAAX protease family)
MKLIVLLLGPTIMILIGLTIFQNVPLTFLLFYSWLCLVPLISYKRNGKSLFTRKIPNSTGSIVTGLLSGIIFSTLILGTVSLLIEYLFDIAQLQHLLEKWGFSGKGLIWLILVLIVINPVLEELYWREYMFTRLTSTVGTTMSILICAFAYSLYHFLSLVPMFNWPLNVISALPVFLAGIIWGSFRLRFQSIVAPIISHILADAGIMLVYILHLTEK